MPCDSLDLLDRDREVGGRRVRAGHLLDGVEAELVGRLRAVRLAGHGRDLHAEHGVARSGRARGASGRPAACSPCRSPSRPQRGRSSRRRGQPRGPRTRGGGATWRPSRSSAPQPPGAAEPEQRRAIAARATVDRLAEHRSPLAVFGRPVDGASRRVIPSRAMKRAVLVGSFGLLVVAMGATAVVACHPTEPKQASAVDPVTDDSALLGQLLLGAAPAAAAAARARAAATRSRSPPSAAAVRSARPARARRHR